MNMGVFVSAQTQDESEWNMGINLRLPWFLKIKIVVHNIYQMQKVTVYPMEFELNMPCNSYNWIPPNIERELRAPKCLISLLIYQSIIL